MENQIKSDNDYDKRPEFSKVARGIEFGIDIAQKKKQAEKDDDNPGKESAAKSIIPANRHDYFVRFSGALSSIIPKPIMTRIKGHQLCRKLPRSNTIYPNRSISKAMPIAIKTRPQRIREKFLNIVVCKYLVLVFCRIFGIRPTQVCQNRQGVLTYKGDSLNDRGP